LTAISIYENDSQVHLDAMPDDSIDQPRPCSCADLRCACGNLLARLVRGGVEIKCRRCRRVVTIPLRATAITRAAP
jgi:phage FluMu protein Com